MNLTEGLGLVLGSEVHSREQSTTNQLNGDFVHRQPSTASSHLTDEVAPIPGADSGSLSENGTLEGAMPTQEGSTPGAAANQALQKVVHDCDVVSRLFVWSPCLRLTFSSELRQRGR